MYSRRLSTCMGALSVSPVLQSLTLYMVSPSCSTILTSLLYLICIFCEVPVLSCVGLYNQTCVPTGCTQACACSSYCFLYCSWLYLVFSLAILCISWILSSSVRMYELMSPDPSVGVK